MCPEFALQPDCCQEPCLLPADDMGHGPVHQSAHQAQQQRQHFPFIQKYNCGQYQVPLHHFTSSLVFLVSAGLILGSKAQTGILQYEAVELLFCLSFVLVLSPHRSLYKDVLSHLQKRTCHQETHTDILKMITQKCPVKTQGDHDCRSVYWRGTESRAFV